MLSFLYIITIGKLPKKSGYLEGIWQLEGNLVFFVHENMKAVVESLTPFQGNKDFLWPFWQMGMFHCCDR